MENSSYKGCQALVLHFLETGFLRLSPTPQIKTMKSPGVRTPYPRAQSHTVQSSFHRRILEFLLCYFQDVSREKALRIKFYPPQSTRG